MVLCGVDATTLTQVVALQLNEDVTEAEFEEIRAEVDVGGGCVDYGCVGVRCRSDALLLRPDACARADCLSR